MTITSEEIIHSGVLYYKDPHTHNFIEKFYVLTNKVFIQLQSEENLQIERYIQNDMLTVRFQFINVEGKDLFNMQIIKNSFIIDFIS